jgi:cytoskeleton protein RodZ
MAEKNHTKASSTQEVKEPGSSIGLGAVLRNEREKQGLTLDRVASVTKLRGKMVEALENETWEDLPQPVFVRGFIRSYAGVLGLDEKELLYLYERVVPSQADTRKPAEAQHRSRKGFILLGVIFVLILGFIAYLLVERPSSPGEPLIQKRQAVLEGGQEKRDAVPAADHAQAGGEKAPSPVQGTTSLAQEVAALPPAVPPIGVEKAPEVSIPAEVRAPAPSSAVEPQAGTVSPDTYELKGVVLDETWVRIQIDNGEPKEYIFQPGARPQWKAKEGFYLTVGNAAGIELELNGTKLKSLGKPGKVVKLTLPASFGTTRAED